ncbi:hypothetical protein [Anaeromyxobacter oryzae]|uniref:Uncharacterized protein n=1 Tax=Anaeromyxobacter oryzae TaxID=2918170 RepID=A0ABM7WUM2_9BACT|nr:hypothetical protein [Anaeromyxobacter oryzae]BDG03196.1 hypothetical protein AMOR_21920 [Anaeromyxobacter oryzae]
MLHLAVLLAAFLPAAAVSPARVPAHGRQTATLTVERPGMVRLATSGGGGTACTVVDQLRGPFAASGAAGRTDCAQDLLLDAGPYRLLLDSREKGQGEVAVQAALFADVNTPPARLEPGAPVEAELPDGKQASWWIHLDRRAPVTVRVAGRTAGAVHLWRGGAWREPLEPLHSTVEPLPGQPIHEWWLEGVLEAGDYLLTAYGTGALRFTRGEEHARLAVQYGLPAPADRAVRVRLPPSGAAAFALGAGRLGAVLTVTAPGPGPARLSLHPLGPEGSRMGEQEGGCEVSPKALVPECGAWSGDGEGHVLVVRGPPGAEAEVRWAPLGASPRMVDGEYRGPERRVALEPLAAGEWLVGVHDVPADRDAAPLGCALERQPESGGPREIVAWDVPRVAATHGWRRAFNYAREASLWFEVVAPGEYAISAQRATCELYRVSGEGERLDGAPKACALQRRLAPGIYELRLRGGRDGIEEVAIAPRGAPIREAPARAGCAMRVAVATGQRYALLSSRTGGAFARGLVARRLPLALERALPVEVHAGETLTLPVDARGPIRVATPGGSPAGCWLARGGAGTWRDGACWLQASGSDELSITARPEAPLAAWIGRPVETLPPPAAPRPWTPAPAELATLALERPARLDLGPGEDHAFVFDVVEAGLYDVGTEGLLRTRCALRTPALARLAEDVAGGRGRNCLVSAWLRPGRYLVSVRAEAPSHGRATVVLGRRTARDLARVAADGELFHRVPAGELVRARLAAPAAGAFELSTAAPGAELRCRVEDATGWPLAPVPGPCRVTLDLPAGEVVLAQLPLSVESRRRTAIVRARPPEVLRGETPHTLAFWTRYAVELGKAGRDELRFDVPAEMDVSILLTNEMMGRLYRDGEVDPFAIVPPAESATPAAIPDAPEAAEGEAEHETDDAEQEGTAEDETGDAVGDAAAPLTPALFPRSRGGGGALPDTATSRTESARAASRTSTPRGPEGFRIHLAPGRYQLVAEHARGDVAIAYEVQLTSDVLAPGMARDVKVPARLAVRVPADGTLRLRTRGDADVRCRLLDGGGRVVAESSEVGEDWNCGFAEPVARGDHLLVIESETRTSGTTRVVLEEPAPVEAGALAEGTSYSVGPGVLAAALPAPAGDAVLDVALDGPVSCAIEDETGRVLFRAGAPAPCRAILAPAGRPLRLRAWTLDRPAAAVGHVRARPVAALEGGKVGAAQAARARVERPGRYRTGEGVLCLAGSAAGALAPCGPEVSLDEGPIVLAGLGYVKVALEEQTADVEKGSEATVALGRGPWLQRQVSRGAALHVAAVSVPPGEPSVPACRLDARDPKEVAGIFTVGPGSCFAAAGLAQGAVLALRAGAPVEARLWRAAIPLPDAVPLAPGRHRLEGTGGVRRLALPEGPVRAELLLPPEAWAVLLADGAARDLCGPAGTLARCVLTTASRAELVVVAPGERRVEAEVTRLAAPPPPAVLAGLLEEVAPLPGVRVLRVPPATVERRIRIDGGLRCTIAQDDGGRSGSCTATLAPGVGALVTIEHGGGPLRAVVGGAGDALAAAGGPLPSSPSPVAPGQAVRLEGAAVDVAVALGAEAAVHVRADGGVCVLAPAAAAPVVEGLGDGCRLDRVLPAGTHRLRVRAFAGRPLAGALAVTTEPVLPLAEGVGPETWIGPGEARVFRFTVASSGKVGLGVREEAETLACTVTDAADRALGEGCQALLALEKGSYLLAVRAPPGAPPARFRPVLLGLAGAETGVPEDVLRDLFQRIGELP